jgi:hypothetical protein
MIKRSEQMLSDMDIEWAEFVAERKLSQEEIAEFKADYEAWVDEMERAEDHRIFG